MSPIADFVAAHVEAPERRRRNALQLPHVLAHDIDEAIREKVLRKNQFPERTQRRGDKLGQGIPRTVA